MELLTSILSKDFIDLAPPDANAPEEGNFFFQKKINFPKKSHFSFIFLFFRCFSLRCMPARPQFDHAFNVGRIAQISIT